MNVIFRNPLTVWAAWLFRSARIHLRNRGKHLSIGYLARVEDCCFGRYVTIYDGASLSHSTLGDCTFVASATKIHRTKIGKFCSIGPDCKIGLGRHPSTTFVSTHPAFYSTRGQSQVFFADRDYFTEFQNIEIGSDVWIGAGAMVVDGVELGDGAIVAAGSVVTKSVPAYSIVGGVPAKLIRYRFTEEQIARLLENPWWEQDLEYLKTNFLLFHNIDDYLSTIG